MVARRTTLLLWVKNTWIYREDFLQTFFFSQIPLTLIRTCLPQADHAVNRIQFDNKIHIYRAIQEKVAHMAMMHCHRGQVTRTHNTHTPSNFHWLATNTVVVHAVQIDTAIHKIFCLCTYSTLSIRQQCLPSYFSVFVCDLPYYVEVYLSTGEVEMAVSEFKFRGAIYWKAFFRNEWSCGVCACWHFLSLFNSK